MRLVGSIGLKSDPEMEQEFEDALRFFDKDGRGLISAGQLKSALQCYGEPLENEDLNELMRLADAKGDGKIDYLGRLNASRSMSDLRENGPRAVPPSGTKCVQIGSSVGYQRSIKTVHLRGSAPESCLARGL